MNEPLISGDWEPAAEILSRVFGSRGEGSLRHLGVRAIDLNHLLQQTFKDHEDETSQLNRLGVAYFHLAYFRFQPRYIGIAL